MLKPNYNVSYDTEGSGDCQLLYFHNVLTNRLSKNWIDTSKTYLMNIILYHLMRNKH